MFEKIDSQLNDWLKLKELHLHKHYKDEEVRSIDIITKKGKKYQIWLDSVRKNSVKINVWDYRKLKVEYTTTFSFFTETLERAYSMILLWEK